MRGRDIEVGKVYVIIEGSWAAPMSKRYGRILSIDGRHVRYAWGGYWLSAYGANTANNRPR